MQKRTGQVVLDVGANADAVHVGGGALGLSAGGALLLPDLPRCQLQSQYLQVATGSKECSHKYAARHEPPRTGSTRAVWHQSRNGIKPNMPTFQLCS
jgi:hypothetical protein